MALSLCQALSQKTALATRERAYHGLVGLSRSMTVQPHWHGGLAVQAGGSRTARPDGAGADPACADGRDLRRAAEQPAGQGFSPMPARAGGHRGDHHRLHAGRHYYDGDYQDEVALRAREAGSIWIADEVVTGAGRSGRWFAFQGAESRPDIVTLGKSLGGGAAAVAAVVVSRRSSSSSRDRAGRITARCAAIRSAWPPSAPISMWSPRKISSRGCAPTGRILHEAPARDRSTPSERGAALRAGPALDRRAARARLAFIGRRHHGKSDRLPRVAARAMEAGAVIGTSGEQTSLFLAPPLVIQQDAERLLAALDHGLQVADEEHERNAAPSGGRWGWI